MGLPSGTYSTPKRHPHPPQCEHWGTFPQGKAWAGGASPSPTGFKENFRVWVGEALGPPADHVPANTCSAKLGAEVKSQPLQFSTRSGPSGPEGEVESHSDFARRKYCKARQVRVLRNGVRGKRSYGHEVSIGRVPGDPLGTFPSGGLSSEVQRFVEKEFKRRFPAQAFARATI